MKAANILLSDCNLYADKLTESLYVFPELHSNHLWWQPSTPNISIHWPRDLYKPVNTQHGKQLKGSTGVFRHLPYQHVCKKTDKTCDCATNMFGHFCVCYVFVWVFVYLKPKPLVNQDQCVYPWISSCKLCLIYILSQCIAADTTLHIFI